MYNRHVHSDALETSIIRRKKLQSLPDAENKVPIPFNVSTPSKFPFHDRLVIVPKIPMLLLDNLGNHPSLQISIVSDTHI